jgi:hypothetical protein
MRKAPGSGAFLAFILKKGGWGMVQRKRIAREKQARRRRWVAQALLLALGLLMLPAVPANIAAAGAADVDLEVHLTPPPDGELITSVTETTTYDFWHYSGGYWKAGVPVGGTVMVQDGDMADPAALASLMGFIMMVRVAAPADVTAAIAAGDRVAVVLSAGGGIMQYIEVSSLPLVKISGGAVEVKAVPKLNMYDLEEANYQVLVPGMTQKFPVVRPQFGTNLYSIFSKAGGGSLGWAMAYYNNSSPAQLGSDGTIHWAQILNTAGDLVPGFTVRVYSTSGDAVTEYPSEDVRIGQGTFANGGALGLRFVYPFTLSFYRLAGADLTVTDIQPRSFVAGTAGVYRARIKNLTDQTLTNIAVRGTVRKGTTAAPGAGVLSYVNHGLTLAGGEEKWVDFIFGVPNDGTQTLVLQAEVNPNLPEGRLTETDYSNNLLNVDAEILSPELPDATVGCNTVITWIETDSHEVTVTNEDGTESSETCSHSFVYKTTLTTAHSVEPKTLKSGYGTVVEVETKILTEMESNSGCGWGSGRAPTLTPTPPTKAEVRNPWKVVMKMENRSTQTQPYTVPLQKVSSTATEATFHPAPAAVSEIRAKKIYTPVELEGSADWPKTHTFEIYVSGGGIPGVEFCKTIREQLTINGVMYDDDITSAAP